MQPPLSPELAVVPAAPALSRPAAPQVGVPCDADPVELKPLHIELGRRIL